jgi:hypothetical protein
LFARGGDSREGDFARNAKEIERFAGAYPGHNIYVAPNPTNSTKGARHTAADVTHWSYFLIDMDPVEEVFDAEAALGSALYWLGEWANQDLRGCIVIDSGRGRQAWIRLEDIPLDDEGGPGDLAGVAMVRSIARRVNGYWLKRLDEKLGTLYGCKIDTSVSDLPRVMRCPGTVNAKTLRTARIVHGRSDAVIGLAQFLTDNTPATVFAEPEAADIAVGQPWQMVFAHLTLTAQEYLKYGKAEPGRHKVMWHTAKKFHELGVTRREARKALRWANQLQGEDFELDAGQIEHALNTAYNLNH